MATSIENPESTDLASRWSALRAAEPALRTRDAAAQLGVSEAELVATMVGGQARRLVDDPASLLHALPEVGRCMALTRNDHAVSEVRGRYGGVELGGHAGQVVGEGIDLRVFPSHWRYLFEINEPHPRNAAERRRSIHVFDRSGTAVHKIYLEPESDVRAWDAIVASRVAGPAPMILEPAPPRRAERPDAEIDVAAFTAAWDAMTDTHEFFHLLSAHQVARTQALRLAGIDRARRVRNDALSLVLHDAAESQERIMIFVGNRGCLQVFSGAVKRIVRVGPPVSEANTPYSRAPREAIDARGSAARPSTWLNVMDPGFNLHLREDRIAASWVVAKPTRAGVVRSLELFDAAGETIALVFRKRDDRESPEDPAWHGLLDRLAEAR